MWRGIVRRKGERYRPIVTILKMKKDKPTVIMVSGEVYQLQHRDQFKRGRK